MNQNEDGVCYTSIMKVSVVLPTYNRAQSIRSAIDSVLAQTYRDFELIIVDDGSTDSTRELVEQYSDKRIRYIRHEKNRGLAAGRNTGARDARGIFIANQDSDDIWMPEKLQREVHALESAYPRVGVAYSRLEKVFSEGAGPVYIPASNAAVANGNLHRKLLEGNFITMQVALMRKECFEKVGGFDESLSAFQDWDFWLRVSNAYEFVYVPEVGVRARVSLDSITKNKAKRLIARTAIFRKYQEEFSQYPAVYATHAFSIGNAYALRKEWRKARVYLRQAAVYAPTLRHVGAFMLALIGSQKLYRRIARVVS